RFVKKSETFTLTGAWVLKVVSRTTNNISSEPGAGKGTDGSSKADVLNAANMDINKNDFFAKYWCFIKKP
ncbi:hypothetical protein ACS81_01425, partial [Vibrio parahaemolyticus]